MKKIILLFILFICGLLSSTFAQELKRGAAFGAQVADLTDSTRLALKLASASGTILKQIVPNSSAQKAGFMANDVLVSINDQKIENTVQFLQLLKKQHGGDKVKIGFYRKSKLKTTTITLLPKPMETSDAFDIIYSSVVSGKNHLRTIITKPKGNGKYPAVLMVGGVGCYSIDNIKQTEILSMKMWVDSLTENGFVTIRVEKTGMGDSKGIPCNLCDYTTEKQGYLDGLKQLKSLPYVDQENVFIAGFSIGGVVAPQLAAAQKVKGIIVYGTAGRNWLEYEIDNSLRQQILDGKTADSIDKFMRMEYIRLYGLFVEKKQPEQILKEYPEMAAHLLRYPMRIEYFQEVADINIREMWMNTKVKVLALHGSSDFVSSATEHKSIAEIVNQYNPGNATYLEIAGSDHWGLMAETDVISATWQQTGLNSLALTTSIKWLKKNL